MGASALRPVPASLRRIERAPVDCVARLRQLREEAKRLGVKPVFGDDPFRADYGRLLGVL